MSTAVSPVEFATIVSDSSAQESPMRTTFAAVRTFLMAFLILAGSLGAVLASPAQDVAAAGPCQVGAVVKYGVSNGSYYVYGRGAASCTYNVPQSMIVRLYANGYLVREAPHSVLGTTLMGNSGWVWGRCGVAYQVSMTHHVLGFSSTTTWTPKAYLC